MLSVVCFLLVGTAFLIWFTAASRQRLRHAAGLSDAWRTIDRGERLALSDEGGGTVNGVELWSLVRVEVYERGVLVRVNRLMASGGGIWIPADEARLSTVKEEGFFGGVVDRHVLSGAGHRVILSPTLADPDVLRAIRRARFEMTE